MALSLPAASEAQDDNEALVNLQVMKVEVALELAQAALESCREQGFQVAVAVVDRFGVTQVVLRDRFAGPHTTSTSQRKAWTSVSFRAPTTELSEATAPGQEAFGARDVTNALMLGGGLPVDAAGTMVGAVGVSGAPSGLDDENCAQAGIDAVADQLAF
ncbi:MAG: heme-binding protein [Limibacillus sp.]